MCSRAKLWRRRNAVAELQPNSALVTDACAAALRRCALPTARHNADVRQHHGHPARRALRGVPSISGSGTSRVIVLLAGVRRRALLRGAARALQRDGNALRRLCPEETCAPCTLDCCATTSV